MPQIGKRDQPPNIYIGIDPGASGGIAVIKGKVVEACAMPATEADIWAEISRHYDLAAPGIYAVIERNTGYVGGYGNKSNGKLGNPGSAMFKFGRNAGLLTMALTAAAIPHEEAMPSVWQKAMGLPSRKGASQREHKNKLKAFAQKLFPVAVGKITLNTADALLIAEYCRRKQEGKL